MFVLNGLVDRFERLSCNPFSKVHRHNLNYANILCHSSTSEEYHQGDQECFHDSTRLELAVVMGHFRRDICDYVPMLNDLAIFDPEQVIERCRLVGECTF